MTSTTIQSKLRSQMPETRTRTPQHPIQTPTGPVDSFAKTPDTMSPLGSPLNIPTSITAGPTQSPQFLPDEASFFKAYLQMAQSAQPGDILCNEMYEFQNAATNPTAEKATNAPGYADQEAYLPAVAAATQRGVQFDDVLDGSKDKKSGELNNAPIQNYLLQNGDPTHESLLYYPANTVNIDHAKVACLLHPTGNGTYQVQEAIVSGSNLGTHTPANNDGGIALYGNDATQAAQVFFHDAALSSGQTSPLGMPDPNGSSPVRIATTSPTNDDILQQKMALLNQANGAYVSDYCLTEGPEINKLASMGSNAHVTLDPSEKAVNNKAFQTLQQAGCDVKWANVAPGQLLHKKASVYLKDGQIIGGSIGSANETANGLQEPGSRPTNHEVDAIITPYTDGNYSTMPALEGLLANLKQDNDNGLETAPKTGGSNDPF